ncbi:MAG: hypothetical protein Q3993_06640 [Filifactor alocis]|nr:hypothetical protein [Filifactor alocis]
MRIFKNCGKDLPSFAKKGSRLLAILLVLTSIPAQGFCTKAQDQNSDYAFYNKNGKIFYVNTKDPKNLKETPLTSGEKQLPDKNASERPQNDVVLVPGKQAAVFFEDLNSSHDNALYYKVLDKKESALLIDDKVNDYIVSKDGKELLYSKGESHSLFLWSFDSKQKEALGEDVYHYEFSKEGRSLIFTQKDALYAKSRGKKAEKIAQNVDHIHYFNEDASDFLYSKEETLYSNKKGKEEKISDDTIVLRIFDSGRGYFISKSKDLSFKDIIDIDVPAEGAKKDIFSYGNGPEDIFRWWTVHSLWYFDGTSATKVSDRYFWWQSGIMPEIYTSFYIAEDKEEIIFEEIDLDKIKKIPLSQIKDLDDFHNKAEHIEGEFRFVVANKDKVRELPLKAKDIQEGSTFLSSDGTKLWSLRNFDSQRRLADLYLLTIKEGEIGESKLIASKVLSDSPILPGTSRPFYFPANSGEAVLYFKVNNNKTKDVVLNGKSIDRISSIAPSGHTYDEATQSLLYFTDEKGNTSTLKLYRDKKARTLAKNVAEAHFIKNGKPIYLAEQGSKKGDGKAYYKLYLYDTNKSVLISKDVENLYPASIRY